MEKPVLATERFETAAEFETWYAENSGVTVDALHQFGMYGAPCNCGEGECRGWQMTHKERAVRRNSQEKT